MSALELPKIAHTGVPSTQLQALSTINPADPASVYEVKSAPIVSEHSVGGTQINIPAPVVHIEAPVVNVPAPIVRVAAPIVNMPEQKTMVRSVERDADGRIVSITERANG
jgi:hypothetical protein